MKTVRLWMTAVVLALCGVCQTAQAADIDYRHLEPLKLKTPEMVPGLKCGEMTMDYRTRRSISTLTIPASASTGMEKYRLTWMRTNPGVEPYKVMDDLTFVGVPLFVAGIIAKSEKKSFRQNDGSKHVLLTDFKTRIDDYTQFFGPAMTVGLKVGGVEGRSDWGRLLASAAMSYGIMAGFVNGIKYTAKEMRPDGSSANSWPSGHTATSFVGATILHKEYGMTRSPWYSVAGYGVATATGVMRVLNNRHWVSDVLSGAGIGIMSGELAYALSDVIFKGKGLLRNDISGERSIIDHPSFFSISMGIGMGSRDMDFDMTNFEFPDDENKAFNLKFGASTVVGAEGAYFFNKYFGVGGRLRVYSSPIKGWDGIENYAWVSLVENLQNDGTLPETDYEAMLYGTEAAPYPLIDIENSKFFTIQSDHLTEFSADLGVYFNYPISNRFALGSKLLVGRSIMQEINLQASVTGYQRDISYDIVGDDLVIAGVTPLNVPYTTEWDYFTVGGNNTMKVGTGLSLTYAYKDNFAWKVFLDYDFSKKTYTMEYNPGEYFIDAIGLREIFNEAANEGFDMALSETQRIKKNRHTFVFGGSFVISF